MQCIESTNSHDAIICFLEDILYAVELTSHVKRITSSEIISVQKYYQIDFLFMYHCTDHGLNFNKKLEFVKR